MYCEGGRSRTGRIGEDRASPGSAAWRSSRARRSCRSRCMARRGSATGAPPVPEGHGPVRRPFRYERIDEPTRDQQQAVADDILDEISTLYDALEAEGRSGALARARAERRARRAKRTAAA